MLVDQVERSPASADIDILVVDNDPEASGSPTVERWAAASGVALRYVNEPTPGISAARNRALDESDDRDILVFIDDDERPTAHWLRHLMDAHAEYGATTVNGPVVSEFEVQPDSWIRAGRFFDRRRMPTGSRLHMAGTGNMLIDLVELRRLGIRFDNDLGISGGEDSLFTRQIDRSGGCMIWCDEAIVLDIVPAARLTRQWVLLRVLRYGTSWSVTALKVEPRAWMRLVLRLRLSLEGLVRLVVGGSRAFVGSVARSERHQARGLRTTYRGVGLLMGAWGYSYDEYRREPVIETV